VPTELEISGARAQAEVEASAYFTVAEALTNTAKHARATVAEVDVDIREKGMLHIEVSDDGRGGADLRAGSGLLGLKDRVEALGGTFAVQGAPGGGTTLLADLPLSGARPEPDARLSTG